MEFVKCSIYTRLFSLSFRLDLLLFLLSFYFVFLSLINLDASLVAMSEISPGCGVSGKTILPEFFIVTLGSTCGLLSGGVLNHFVPLLEADTIF